MQSAGFKSSRVGRKKSEDKSPDGRGWLYVLISYYGFEYVRFQDSFLPFLSPLKIPMILTLLLSGYVLLNFKKIQLNKTLISILIIWSLILAWIPFATNNFHAFQVAKSMSMLFFSCFATILIIDTREKFNILLNFLIVYFIIVSLWIIFSNGQGPGGFLHDENDAALFMVCALPFVFYSVFRVKRRLFRYFLIFGTVSIVAAIILTFSRGGFLGLVAVVSFMIWLSRKRWKIIFISSLLLVVLGGVAFSVLPKGYVDDMSTISDKDDGTRNLRLLHWTTAIEIFKDNPVFGVGPNNYPWISNKYLHLSPYFNEGARFRSGRQSHSLYFTLIPELGLVGIIAFLVVIYKYRSNTIKVIRNSAEEEGRSIGKSLYASLVGFLVAGTFVSVLYYPILWHLVFVSLAFHQIEVKYSHLSKTKELNNGKERKKKDFVNNSRAKI